MKFNIKLILFSLSLFVISPAYSLNKQNNISNPVIIIDPGHGGKDVGAVEHGVKEKDVNLGVAKKLHALIKKNLKNSKAILTREDDTYLTLQQRADIANKNKGNLFISIHANSVERTNPNRRNISGASVYVLGPQKDQNNLQVARRENSVIELESNFEQKYSGFDPSKDESYIIFELSQKRNLNQSLKFANLAQKSLVSIGKRNDKGVKQAGFWVLWATSMPSALVELDFICNPESAQFLNSEKGQAQLAKALFSAVESYFKRNGHLETRKDSDNLNDVELSSTGYTPVLVSPSKDREIRTISRDMSKSGRNIAMESRKRRSADAKAVSDSRIVETAYIIIHEESERMPVSLEKDSLKLKDREPLVAKQNNKKEKTYKKDVKNSSNSPKTSSDTNYHPKQSKIRKVYKIQILSSSQILKQNNEKFCGLSPVKSFRENNVYKYTYGESEKREEIEELLIEVRKKIPDAFIISNLK